MSETEKTALRDRLAELQRAVDTKLKTLNERGELSSAHEAYAGDLKQRQAALHQKLEKAVHDHSTWEAMKDEIQLDVSALFSEFRGWEEQLDTDATKNK